MKIQTLAVIFIIITLPISIVLSAFTSSQIDSISVQTMYATKLRDATYDAIVAFQLNTADNKYSTVSYSMKRDVEASIQTFISTFAKNLGASGLTENSIKPYIPAVVFTLYDGYYIYAPSFNYGEVNMASVDGENGYSQTSGEYKNKEEFELNPDGSIKTDEHGNYIKKNVKVFEANTENFTTQYVIDNFANKEDIKDKYEHILTPYIYYSARYNPNSDIDVVVNYSLDNYVVIYGKVNGKEITKSGYLINPDKISETDRWLRNTSERLVRHLPISVITYTDKENKSMINDQAIYETTLSDIRITSAELQYDRLSNSPKTMVQSGITIGQEIEVTRGMIDSHADLYQKYIKSQDGTYLTGKRALGWFVGVSASNDKSSDHYVDSYSAFEFYDEAKEFTQWVKDNLSTIKASDAKKLDNQEYTQKNSEGNEIKLFGDTKIFDFSNNNDPEDEGSVFNSHKREIIKQSIENNLAQAIKNYNAHSEALGTTYNFKMPILSETEWDSVLKNVSLITFVQGLQAGTKMYNDYAIVNSTTNKEFISPDSIYYINTTNSDGCYHRIGCSHLNNGDDIVGYRNSEFDRQSYEEEVFKTGTKEIVDKKSYYYMHPNYTACYYCIGNSTKDGDSEDIEKPGNENRLKAQTIALYREKYNFYKVNSYLREQKPPLNTREFPSSVGTKDTMHYSIEDTSRPGSQIECDVYLPKVEGINKYPLVIIEDGDSNINWISDSIKRIFRNRLYGVCIYTPQGASDLDKQKELKYLLYYLRDKHYVDKNNIFVIASGDNAAVTALDIGNYKADVKAITLISPSFNSSTDWEKVKIFDKDVLLIRGNTETNNAYEIAERRYNSIKTGAFQYSNRNNINSNEVDNIIDKIKEFLDKNRRSLYSIEIISYMY